MNIVAPNFSLVHTLESGQIFRYTVVAEGFLVSHADKAFVISEADGMLRVHYASSTVSEQWLRQFFSLDQELPVAVDDYSARALAYCTGMRVCTQDPWECTIGFLCSQNNTIKRIRSMMQGLAQAFGKKIVVGPYLTYAFPDPGQIRAGAALRALKLGYREKYVLAANTLVNYDWLQQLAAQSYDDQKQQLLSLPGVGPKVADCILLFAFGQHHAFPIDTWVHQIMTEQYGGGTKEQMLIKARELFGEKAGIMQQYLFHYRRNQ